MRNDMKHVETHEYIGQRLMDTVDWTTAELVCLWCFFLIVSVIVPWLFFLVHVIAHCIGSRLMVATHPHFTHMFHVSSVVSVASDLFDLSTHFLSFFIIFPITLLFLLPDVFNFHDVVDKYTAYSCWGPWHSGRERTSHRLWAQRPLHQRGLCGIHPGVSGEQQYPDDFDFDDAPRRVPKTSRSIWRRRPVVMSVVVSQSLVERGDPLFAQVPSAQNPPKKLRETPLRLNRSGFFWNDKGSRFSLTVKRRFESTNSRPITTEEVYKN